MHSPRFAGICSRFRRDPLGATGILTFAEVSVLLGFHEGTLRDWARTGRLPALRIAGAWRFDAAEIAAWVEVRRIEWHVIHSRDRFT